MSLPNPVPKADVSQTHPHDWSYVSEGGATIVFSYSGPPSKEFSGTVLRLRKITAQPPPQEIYKPLDIAEGIDQASSEEDDGYDTSSSEDEDEPEDPTIAFQSRITSKLIPPEHLPRLEPAKLKRHFLEKLAKRGDKKRPQSRKDVDRIDTHKKKGVIATDLIGGNGWAVEIKPKWAFLANPAHLSDETKETKGSYCRFCMHTHQRFIKDPAKFKTEYCPLDLFSGDRERQCGQGDRWLAPTPESWMATGKAKHRHQKGDTGITLMLSSYMWSKGWFLGFYLEAHSWRRNGME
ncbi:hypothetical protein M407DRAFT_6633 [Tulasnella calospora MUT 4182]|uniref:Inositol-pentakisphosphate 2-kinase n=1 Tax=Tulasnella calospora MUT 4182 TaxID=1051891 RepID=A0A0C3QCZ7_9AGAM|nr:hypothetical protein M407DRAFT_6633 [Tulasnella calospora MUT 4182]